MDICLAFGFKTMSHVDTWKGNEFIALASDVSFDYPVGGFYSGYYDMKVTRHMKEFGTTPEQMAHVSVKESHECLIQSICSKEGEAVESGCAPGAYGGLAINEAGYLCNVRWRGRCDSVQ